MNYKGDHAFRLRQWDNEILKYYSQNEVPTSLFFYH